MTYTLTETKAPEGHELSKKTTWKIKIASNGTVTVDGKIVTTSDDTIQLTIENPFIEIPIAVRKYTMQGTGKEMNLKGAAFALQKKKQTVLISQWTTKQRMKKVLPFLIHSHLENIESLRQLVLQDMILYREIMNSKSINMERLFTREKHRDNEWHVDAYSSKSIKSV